MPKLYIFAISHFCEKARWVLDYLDIEYELAFLAPGLHAAWCKKNGLESSTLPVLDTDDELIQGSERIIDWADEATTSSRRLTPVGRREECAQIEQRLDEVIGVHIRRMFYSEALIEHSATVRPIFTKDLSTPQRLLITAVWPVIRSKMIQVMDLGREQGEESRKIVDGELAWLDGLLSDGRRFLVGASLSRADIAASGLLARAAGAEQYPSAKFMKLPPRLEANMQEWSSRPSIEWVRENYREYR